MQLPDIPEITYSLRDRGRRYTGVDRDFNIPAVVKHINGPEVQEKVANRELLGYYGHGVRQLIGLDPAESFVSKGQYNEVEPAIVTTRVRAENDGTIIHKTEFLPTGSGEKAAKAWSAKVGGFSSAIDGNSWKFYGFDYVFNPNYAKNRGFLFDSATGGGMMAEGDLEDLIEAVRQEDYQMLSAILDKAQSENQMLRSALSHAEHDIEDLMSTVMRLEKQNGVMLDSASIERDGFAPAMVLDASATRDLQRRISAFESANLADRPQLEVKKQPSLFESSISRLFGIG